MWTIGLDREGNTLGMIDRLQYSYVVKKSEATHIKGWVNKCMNSGIISLFGQSEEKKTWLVLDHSKLKMELTPWCASHGNTAQSFVDTFEAT
jgi:hypothetical protein